MADPEELEDDLFADLYEGDDVPSKPAAPSSAPPEPAVSDIYQHHEPVEETISESNGMNGNQIKHEEMDDRMQGGWDGAGNQHYDGGPVENDDNYGPVGIKEDG